MTLTLGKNMQESMIAVSPIGLEDFLALLPPIQESEELGDLGVSIAADEGRVFAKGPLIGLLGEAVAKEASRNGKSTFTIWDDEAQNYQLSRFEGGASSDRVEVSGYDVIEDTMGVTEVGRNVADWRDLNLDGAWEWATGEISYWDLPWHNYRAADT